MAKGDKAIEQEVIVLKAVKELIDEMVNFELMTLNGSDPESSVMFKTMTHQKLFNIVLVDFLSKTDKRGPVHHRSYIATLRHISDNPSFNVDSSVIFLKESTQTFKAWLEQVIEVEIWLPSINKEAHIRLSRITFLKMTGDICKHNYLRAIGVAHDLKAILNESGISVDINEALLALADFYDRFHTDILNYHASIIAEYLNNIRWGIYEYLQPEFKKSIVWESQNPAKYRYTYPTALRSEFAKSCYWELMNEVRSEPYMRKFQVTKWLKSRY